jgi:hypothetical protein
VGAPPSILTFIAEIGGVALAIEIATSVNEVLWVPVVAAALWIVLWRVRFSVLENAFGLVGLALIVFAVALWKLDPDCVDGLIVGARVQGSMLGYDRREIQGPWLVRALVRLVNRDLAYVPWASVRRIDWDDRVVEVDVLGPLTEERPVR